jgi:eukaryotic-like serine/threonine-protein kinase
VDIAGEQRSGQDVGPPPPGTGDLASVPGYELLGVLGTGAGGPVWRARRAGANAGEAAEQVALKIVQGGAQAERELAVLRGIRHEHVVGLRDGVPLADGSLALVLDLVEGGTLAQLVAARGHLRPGEVVTVVAPLAATLAELHAAGIQHGDLAPGNVLFDRDGRPLLSDLGTVRITGEAREEQFGTPGYVDPVVVAGGSASPASDVYGLGALAWFAVTGRTPPGALLREPLDDVVPGLPTELIGAVEAALDPDPARRPEPAALARRIYDAAPAEPVWLVGGTPADGGLTHRLRQLAASDAEADPPRHRRGRRCRPRQGGAVERAAARPVRESRRTPAGRTVARMAVVTAACLVVGAVLVLVVGQLLTRSGSAGISPNTRRIATAARASTVVTTEVATPTDSGPLSDAQAVALVQRLSSTRAAAFTTADASMLRSATAPGSPADRAARTALASLRRQDLVYRGLALRVRSAHVHSATPGALVVDVITDVSAYDVVDGRGVVRRHEAVRPGTTSRLVLLATGDGWRVQDVRG